jgi:hypothetical protein
VGLINLGNLEHDLSIIKVPVWNRPESIRAISSPVALRHRLSDFIPEQTIRGPHWHKRGGFGGDGKVFHENSLGVCAVIPGDTQKHIEGDEYRVITVGDTVVQSHRKDVLDGIGNFDWHWTGVDGIKSSGIIPHIKQAVQPIPHWETSIFGWDIIVNGKSVYTIEINTSPGVNEATAARIVKEMERR